MAISNAIVVGGGIGGLAAAAALARKGVAVTLLEQADRFKEVGAGLQISPNGLAVLRALGAEPLLRQKGAVRAQSVVLRNGENGRTVARLAMAKLRPQQNYYFVHRVDLVDVLFGVAKRANVTFELGGQVASIRPGEVPQVQMVDGSTRRAELIVAADGIHSVARPVLNGPDKAAFSGQVAWRALIPNDIGHADEAHVHMGAGCHMVSYPLRDGRLINLVAVQERQDWAAEGWSEPDDPANMRAAFADFGGPAHQMLSSVRDVSLWGLHLHPVAPRWVGPGVALIGDAAHPTLPFLAQGANLALEDAWVLTDCVTTRGNDGLPSYQHRRMDRAKRVIAAAQKNARRYHLQPGAFRMAAHAGLKLASSLTPGLMVGAFDWLYGHDVTAPPKEK